MIIMQPKPETATVQACLDTRSDDKAKKDVGSHVRSEPCTVDETREEEEERIQSVPSCREGHDEVSLASGLCRYTDVDTVTLINDEDEDDDYEDADDDASVKSGISARFNMMLRRCKSTDTRERRRKMNIKELRKFSDSIALKIKEPQSIPSSSRVVSPCSLTDSENTKSEDDARQQVLHSAGSFYTPPSDSPGKTDGAQRVPLPESFAQDDASVMSACSKGSKSSIRSLRSKAASIKRNALSVKWAGSAYFTSSVETVNEVDETLPTSPTGSMVTSASVKSAASFKSGASVKTVASTKSAKSLKSSGSSVKSTGSKSKRFGTRKEKKDLQSGASQGLPEHNGDDDDHKTLCSIKTEAVDSGNDEDDDCKTVYSIQTEAATCAAMEQVHSPSNSTVRTIYSIQTDASPCTYGGDDGQTTVCSVQTDAPSLTAQQVQSPSNSTVRTLESLAEEKELESEDGQRSAFDVQSEVALSSMTMEQVPSPSSSTDAVYSRGAKSTTKAKHFKFEQEPNQAHINLVAQAREKFPTRESLEDAIRHHQKQIDTAVSYGFDVTPEVLTEANLAREELRHLLPLRLLLPSIQDLSEMMSGLQLYKEDALRNSRYKKSTKIQSEIDQIESQLELEKKYILKKKLDMAVVKTRKCFTCGEAFVSEVKMVGILKTRQYNCPECR